MGSRILIVSPYFYPEGGGLEKYAFKMARELVANGNYVEVVCMTKGKSRKEILDGITIYRIKPFTIVSNTPLGFRFLMVLIKLLKNKKDIVIAHTPVPFAADMAVLFSKFRRIPVLVVYHTVGLKKGNLLLDFLSTLYSMTFEKITLGRSQLIATSPSVWKYLKEIGYFPKFGSIDILLSDITVRNCYPTKKNVILFVGQLGKYHSFKNLHLLIRAFAELSKEFPNWELWVVGDGDLLPEYQKLANSLGVSNRVQFLGRVTNENTLRDIYSQAKVLVLPSSFESFGLVVPEAMALGTLPVVSPNVGAKFLVADKKSGAVLTELSVSALTSTLRKLMSNPKLLRKQGWTAWKKCSKKMF